MRSPLYSPLFLLSLKLISIEAWGGGVAVRFRKDKGPFLLRVEDMRMKQKG